MRIISPNSWIFTFPIRKNTHNSLEKNTTNCYKTWFRKNNFTLFHKTFFRSNNLAKKGYFFRFLSGLKQLQTQTPGSFLKNFSGRFQLWNVFSRCLHIWCSINPFLDNVPILYPLKRQKSFGFLHFSRGIKSKLPKWNRTFQVHLPPHGNYKWLIFPQKAMHSNFNETSTMILSYKLYLSKSNIYYSQYFFKGKKLNFHVIALCTVLAKTKIISWSTHLR